MAWSKPYYSHALEMKYKVHTDGRVATEDRTVYLPEEVQIIKEHPGEITKEIHNVKKAFDGQIVVDRIGTV